MEKDSTFFIQQGRPFPEVSNSKTPTREFLRASESITVLIGNQIWFVNSSLVLITESVDFQPSWARHLRLHDMICHAT